MPLDHGSSAGGEQKVAVDRRRQSRLLDWQSPPRPLPGEAALPEMSAIRARASACVVAACTAIFSACTGDARRSDSGDPPDVRVGTFEDKGVSYLAAMLSSDPLVSVGWNGGPVYRLAESATESADGSVLRFNLRPNVKFHTGEIVTAGRVRELLLRAASLRVQVTDIETPDEHTLLIRLKRAGFLKIVDLGDYLVDTEEHLQLRTGPFEITSLAEGAVLERFAEYHQGSPSVARVEIRKYPTHRAAWTAMMRGEVNFLHEVNRDAIEFLEAGGSIKAYPALRPYVVSLVFNQKHPILQQREVRVAITEAIDRDEIVRNGMRGHGEVAEGPFWPHHWAYSPGQHRSTYNPKAASLRLDSAGLPVRRGRPRQMPSRFQFVCLIREDDPRFERMALVLQRQLFDVGVDMQLQTVPLRELEERLRTGSYESFLLEMASGRTLSFPYRWWHSPNPTGYSAADAALDRMKFARTDDEVRVAVADVMRILRQDPPAVFLASPREARAADRSLDIPYEPDRDIFGTFWQMKRAAVLAEHAR